ncbi:SUMF1/EgtB/PvdO family nonheme iron enzyme [Microcystis aeruginosa]|jgi:formylglycine-generating enzyme required for sulfatase activity|uniref:SUMF1/EgtB/PvdO family nonheme iron enzyme n=1 Tax=Microcystis aeruginosa TaxID=1126 RepID=UPI0012572A32|nr:SUMF1/EgtB/PvdO family nonheme iron enzyme [Microcystis aeruginosa]GCA90600.1 serine/threonine-protein kinase pkn1 [Microcystis aeruginosa NIES-4264]
MPESSEFHVFLCHNSQDKPEVIKIAQTLKQQGLNPWLDVWELRPGLPWQRELERQIEHINAAAVFVGENGIGPWQEMEIEAYLRRFVNKRSPVIPVLLPNAPQKPELPIFLEGMTWVDFRGSQADPIGQLIWGITGSKLSVKPSSSSQSQQVKLEEEISNLPRETKPYTVSTPVILAPKSPRILPLSVAINRRKLLQLIGWTGAGFGATIIGRSVYQLATQPSFSKFEFETLTVNSKGEEISRSRKQAEYFTEDLGNGVKFQMVAIPGGTFMMGAPATEEGSSDEERPQHQVTIPAFSMGKFPVTQKLWIAVASLPKIERPLRLEPSRFKGDDRPVESITWYEAIEFCQRLSKKTGREYRLPSESEWEYACRAVTSKEASQNLPYPPFYFGETITTDLVNFNGNSTYGNAAKGQFRKETTPVGTFPPNAFGLYDMHGNIMEWCADHWHYSYNGAPTDGSAWLSQYENDYRLLRGGSWDFNPGNCRSASRYSNSPVLDFYDVGLRLVCGVART